VLWYRKPLPAAADGDLSILLGFSAVAVPRIHFAKRRGRKRRVNVDEWRMAAPAMRVALNDTFLSRDPIFFPQRTIVDVGARRTPDLVGDATVIVSSAHDTTRTLTTTTSRQRQPDAARRSRQGHDECNA
jgi:hypothetical protein